jgi:hypothetical protein
MRNNLAQISNPSPRLYCIVGKRAVKSWQENLEHNVFFGALVVVQLFFFKPVL